MPVGLAEVSGNNRVQARRSLQIENIVSAHIINEFNLLSIFPSFSYSAARVFSIGDNTDTGKIIDHPVIRTFSMEK